MPSLKPLKSVAHNLPHQFASTLNWWTDDYGINVLAKAVAATAGKRVEFDVLAAAVVPAELESGVVAEMAVSLQRRLRELVAKAGFDPAILASAALTWDFSVASRGRADDLPCYDCICVLTTHDGRTFRAELTEGDNR